MESLFDFAKLSELFTTYAPKVVGAILTLILGLWLINALSRQIKSFLRARGVDESVLPFLSSLVSTGLKVMLLLSVASMFGIETTSFIAIISAMAFAVGLALQGSLGHFASGVLILIFKPYKVGDLVKIDGNVGVVEEIQVFNTLLLTPDNRRVIIPNGVVTSGVMTNISGPGIIRVDMTFGISYGDDIDKARAVIQEVADGCSMVLKDPKVDILVSELADSSVNFAVRPWCKSDDFWAVYFYMHEHIKKAFDKKGVSIPFPQMDVHLPKAG
ncbi:MAG: mechanosensitive ion channel [Saprospiraceae bacterium]|nr:mechanosensitive ion channel [Saprospiraceae bacterium]MCB9306620.1 mechanosensitive ion channel [Lewinellaceae bacterium]MCB9355243.1 mechanosensitive ion channel [Lewinellaceae bacterium]